MSPFLDHLKKLAADIPADDDFRQKAWGRFVFPEKSSDAFQYLPLRELLQKSYAPASDQAIDIKPYIFQECQNSYLVFVNGVYRKELSNPPEQVLVYTLAEAQRTYGNFLKARLTKQLEEENDPFALLNTAFNNAGAFIYVPPKVKISAPIQAIHVYTGTAFPKLHLLISKEAEVKWITTPVNLSPIDFWSSASLDVAVEEAGSFQHINLMNIEADGWHFQAVRATLKTSSNFSSLAIGRGTKLFRQDYKVALAGENAEADLKGISLLSGNAQAHTNVLMEHISPHCRSNQKFKNVLKDNSQSSFQGKIYVHQKAQKTEAYQVNNNLVLGAHAVANSKPNLEIFADDVKASHGATIGQLDQKQLFYLRTRGLSEAEAKAFLVQGFCQEMLDQIPFPFVKKAVAL